MPAGKTSFSKNKNRQQKRRTDIPLCKKKEIKKRRDIPGGIVDILSAVRERERERERDTF